MIGSFAMEPNEISQESDSSDVEKELTLSLLKLPMLIKRTKMIKPHSADAGRIQVERKRREPQGAYWIGNYGQILQLRKFENHKDVILSEKLLIKILSYLHAYYICHDAVLVCKKWYEICGNDEILWKSFVMNEFPNAKTEVGVQVNFLPRRNVYRCVV